MTFKYHKLIIHAHYFNLNFVHRLKCNRQTLNIEIFWNENFQCLLVDNSMCPKQSFVKNRIILLSFLIENVDE